MYVSCLHVYYTDKILHKNLQNDDSENYLHDTTHYKFQFFSKTCAEP